MPKYAYVAFDRAGKKKTGTLEADSQQDAMRLLTSRGMTVSSVKEGSGGLNMELNIKLGSGVKPKDITLFTRQLAVVLRSGLDLAEALSTVKEVSPNKAFQEVVGKVYNEISTGVPFADALEKQKVFPSFLVEMVRAAEAAGNLDDVLSRVAHQLEKNMKLKGKIKSALTYPMVIMVIALLGTGLLLVVVVPQFVGILKSLNTAIPPLTAMVIGVSHFVQHYALFLAGGGIAGGIAFQRWRKTEQGRLITDKGLLRLPVFGGIVQKSALANFAASLGFSLSSGLTIIDALDVTIRIVGIAPIEVALRDVRNRVREGADFSASLNDYPELFPSMMTGMVRVGESSGELEQTLESVADYYEMEVEEATGSLSTIIEPMLMVFLGGVVGTIVAAMFMPMMAAMQHLQG